MSLFRRKEKEAAIQAVLAQLNRIATSLEYVSRQDNDAMEQNRVISLNRIATTLERGVGKDGEASLDRLTRIAEALEADDGKDNGHNQQILADELVRIATALELHSQKKPDEISVAQLTQLTKIADSLEKFCAEKKTIDDKRKAAYALNLCLVSVSQIIDYSDLYILEQEYEGILNNLNLENMPKDEALLDVLRQILDAITFFRIQEGEKGFIEQQYKDEIKTAIWKAVPNCSVIFACPDPKAMLFALVTQVGTSYMNYRDAKAKAAKNKEKALWELQKAAIEQFNGLRRELFTAAWRLADAYQFNDDWRLTEQQIAQYNKILLETNLHCRLARLGDIESQFEAYPPFWYFKGHTALMLSAGDDGMSEEMRQTARNAYEKYFEINTDQHKLLRTDPICAACALEYVSLMEPHEMDLKFKYIDRAVNSAGNHYDILQMCATAYLDMGEVEKGTNLLRHLVCEHYNEGVNAQLLSTIYVAEHLRGDANNHYHKQYQRLIFLTGEKDLVEWPNGSSTDEQFAKFIDARRTALLCEYANFLCKYYYQKRKQFVLLECGNEEVFVIFAKKIEEDLNSLLGVGIATSDFAELMQKNEDGMRKLVKSGKKYDSATFDKFFKDVFFKVASNVSCVELSTMEQITDFLLQVDAAENAYLVENVKLRYDGDAQPVYNIDTLCRLDTGESDDFKKIKDAVLKAKIIKGNPRNTTLLVAGSVEFYRYIRDHSLQETNVVAVINDRTINDCDLLITETGVLVHHGQSVAAKVAKGTLFAIAGGELGTAAGLLVDEALQFFKKEVPYSAVVSRSNKLEKPSYSNKHVDMVKLIDFIQYCQSEFKNEIEVGIRSRIEEYNNSYSLTHSVSMADDIPE